MKKMVARSLLLLCLAVLLISCGGAGKTESDSSEVSGTSSDEEKEIIGFLVKDSEREYWDILQTAAEKAAEENGLEMMFVAPGQDNRAETQIQKLDELIQAGADVICVAPISDEMLQPALQRAADAGIIIIAVDTDTSFQGKSCLIGTDNHAAAKAGAEYAASAVGAGSEAVILRGRLGDKTHDAREEGIREGLEENGVEVVKVLESGPEKAGEQARNLLAEYPDLDLIMTTEDMITLTVSEAMQNDGNTGTAVFGFDGLDEVVGLVKKGQVLGTTRQYPGEMGELCVKNALELMAGKEVEPVQNTGFDVITKENADQF